MKISIEQYIVSNNAREAQALLAKYGVPQAQHEAELVSKLRMLLAHYGDVAAKDLAAIDTEYKQLVTSYGAPAMPVMNAPVAEAKSNCSGGGCSCGGSCGCSSKKKLTPAPATQYSMVTGTPAAVTEYAPIGLVVGLTLVLALVIKS